jgi:hypothetical protein
MLRLIASPIIGLLVLGCAAKSLNVGKNDDEPIDLNSPTCQDASAGIQLPDWPSPDACVAGDEVASLVGVWEGYVQGYPIGNEATTFRVTIVGANAEKGLCGTISFGTHTTPVAYPPPATDPKAVYPTGETYRNLDIWGDTFGVVLGRSYTIRNGQFDGQRVTFEYNTMEPFRSWCEIQTPYPADNSCNMFLCGLNTLVSGNIVDHTCQFDNTADLSCTQEMACVFDLACACNAQRCTANINKGRGSFDLLFNGERAMGTGAGGSVHLQRVTN